MNQRVEFVTYNESVSSVPRYDRFEYNPANGWVLLQCIIFWVLRKIKCHAWDKIVNVEHHVLKTDSLMEGVYAQRKELLSNYHYAGFCLLMGHRQFQELANDPRSLGRITISTTGGYYHEGLPQQMRIFIVPWMDGYLVVPRELKNEVLKI